MHKPYKSVALLAGGLLGFVLVWGYWFTAQGRLPDLAEFLIDRREGAGQTQPDRGAECVYDLRRAVDGQDSPDQLIVSRKAHGHRTTHTLDLAGVLVEPHFGGQQALIETSLSADTYNCITGEFDSHHLQAEPSNPIDRVLFSATGRNVVIILNQPGSQSAGSTTDTLTRGDVDGASSQQRVEVFSFSATPGKSEWNKMFTPIRAEINFKKLTGESLIVVAQGPNGPLIHTYNFRTSHKNQPWNEFDPQSRPFSPPGQLSGWPRFSNRSKQVEVDVRTGDQTLTYRFDYTCTQATEKSPTPDKPCTWTVVQ